MALIGLYTDAHFSSTSSILNMKLGYEFSARLDYLIKSFEWMYREFKDRCVDLIIDGGDLFDNNLIKADEGSAVAKALSYNPGITEYHLLGNHEKMDDAGKFNSLALLNKGNSKVISSQSWIEDYGIALLPYTREPEEVNLEYLSKNGKCKILISHINYAGMLINGYGLFDSGLDMDEVLKYFDLVINGHLHNASSYRDNKVVNIGSVFGTGFGDNYEEHLPGIVVLNTDNYEMEYIPNPYAVLFLKFKGNTIAEITKQLRKYNRIKNPKCVRLDVPYAIRDEAREYVDSILKKYNIVGSRIQGKIESSSVYRQEEKERIKGFNSGADAMREYIDTLDESSLPDTKDNMIKFIDKYLIEGSAE